MRHWKRLPTVVVDALFLETFKVQSGWGTEQADGPVDVMIHGREVGLDGL